ncbi:NAD-dependent epimerase/dehydratase family protein [Schumannella soli]|uniref:NAD(P)-dependent oxidoreductase n=1 Tax=Schumannella soli TaxID=2590779 RepID=A0A506Y170_9MICO|nr:NAD(P)-dependent oxidoreductase [Schumannella soli]TPW75692.1 NAD(P)-dependent oxidoreductase [Schumannella soli]
MRIAVTGASGFVGGAVATALADRGDEVVGFGRTPRGWTHPRGRYRVWDITAGQMVTDQEFDAVVHAAALVDPGASREESMRVNQFGTRNVVRSFVGSRIVHLSTTAVYDLTVPSVDVPESTPPARRFLSGYSASKLAAERELAGADAVLLRPHLIYGSGSPLVGVLLRAARAARGARLPMPSGGRVRHRLTSIGNVVHAVERALRPDTPRGTYNIGDATPVELSSVVTELLSRRGVDVRLVDVDVDAAARAAATLEFAARTARRRPLITRHTVKLLGLERTFDLDAARDRLGFHPTPTTLDGAEDW